MGADYYKILGIPRNAVDHEIKRAYKKMALQWHPDRNKGSEEASRKFKEISEAFEVLSDTDKRKIYDQFGEEGLKRGGQPPGAGFSNFGGFPGATSFTFTTGPGGAGGFSPTDPQRIFEQIFSGEFPGFGSMGGGAPMASIFDDDVGGSFFGGMPGGMPHRASTGSQRATSAPASQPQAITRPLKLSLEDLYAGATKHLKVSRKLANGATEDKILEIQVPPGWKSGTKIRFPRAGNEQPNGESQDLVFVVEEKPHSVFTRDEDNLICHLNIPLVEALTSSDSKKAVELLDGRKLQVPLPFGIVQPGRETRISGEGMPIRKPGSLKEKGDLIIRWDVRFPDRLTPSQKEGLQRVLG
ncbi:hypothetical protein PAXRUDRAFT_822134 [Paxillus rubicundulus Ve08.2h10]|uniref:Unplaced genomic scaffold scaffold_23, whole genome shotgun sequence n=1 Tax=Paxillus rubicundulus Ve08.2h10 TaxID=930991 RepID=A0A0D0DX03_9AGAM|nr:hypothetical protein PAXRUDRAFT_822134 [Paxillus rubicundulus Ve08.2h10]